MHDVTTTTTRGSDRSGPRRRDEHQQPRTCSSIFGITGDLAKVMTFRSLYRLEQRGLLDCPIVGVAVDDWTVDQLRERARDVDRGHRRAARRGGVRPLRRRGSRTSRATSPTPRPTSASAEAIEGAEQPGLLPRDPAVPVRHGGQGPGRGRADRRTRASSSRSRSATTSRRRGQLAGRAAPVHRRVAALPDRPLPREDGPRGDPLPALREHDARAGLEPQLHRVACRSRWPRTSASRTAATSTTRSARCATSSSTT